MGCLLYAICFYKSPFDSVFERGDSVALAVQSNSVKIPKESTFSADVHNTILWMLTPDLSMRPHLQQIIDKCRAMMPKGS